MSNEAARQPVSTATARLASLGLTPGEQIATSTHLALDSNEKNADGSAKATVWVWQSGKIEHETRRCFDT